MSMESTQGVQLPSGWTVANYRETSQADATGRIVQGLQFSLASPLGQISTVFVPSNLLTQTAAVQDVFNERIAAIKAITGQ